MYSLRKVSSSSFYCYEFGEKIKMKIEKEKTKQNYRGEWAEQCVCEWNGWKESGIGERRKKRVFLKKEW